MDGKLPQPYVFHTAPEQGHTSVFQRRMEKNVGVDKAPETPTSCTICLVAFKEQDDKQATATPVMSSPSPAWATHTFRDLHIPAFTASRRPEAFNLDDEARS
jgi:hypothetical protein